MTRINEQVEQYIQKLLYGNSVRENFSASVFEGLPQDIPGGPRRDLRGKNCFTIDCDDTQDMDDAVSLERIGSGYRLGGYISRTWPVM